MIWQTTRFSIDLSRPQVMGIVNVTPDSFSDGGQHASTRSALAHCEQLLKDGADILDIGGESTRPGAPPVPLEEELARVLPVLREAVRLGVPLSVDTYKPQLMQAVLDLGADIINDIWALRWTDAPGAPDGRQVVARHPNCGVCLMHMHREPQTMQQAPMEGDVVPQVRSFLRQSALELQGLGVAKNRIVLDPGIGFGKTVQQNFALLARQPELLQDGYPLLAGWSRKSSLAAVAGIDPEAPPLAGAVHARMVPSVAAALLAVERGAHVVRVHDVRETVQALKVLDAIK
jgi:dihydropteroate synthase